MVFHMFLVLLHAHLLTTDTRIKKKSNLILTCQDQLCVQIQFLFPLVPTFFQGFCLGTGRSSNLVLSKLRIYFALGVTLVKH